MLEKLRSSALAKLFVAMIVGVLLGSVAPGCVIRVLNSFGTTFAQLVKFIVPLIIVGLVTPAIADARRGAGRMLMLTIALAYVSTLLSGAFAFAASDAVFPRILSGSLASSAVAKSFPAYFTFKIPPPVDVVTAMALAVLFGLAMATMRCEALDKAFDEMKKIVAAAIGKAVVPLLPLYIMTVVADLTARETLKLVGTQVLKIVAVVFAVTFSVLIVQYTVAGIIAKRNPFKVLWKMMPAYFTGLGCCSSAATIPVTLRQVRANGVSEETANLVVPLCANIHLAGSIAKVVVFTAGFVLLTGGRLDAAVFAQYVLMLSVLTVAAPGIPGGVVLSAAPIAESIVGLGSADYAVLIAAYLSIDGVGTACNLTGDGAIALIVDKIKAKFDGGDKTVKG